MKKFVFALEMMSLMLVFPVYMVLELNQPITGTEKTAYDRENDPGENRLRGEIGIALQGGTELSKRVK